MTRCAGDCAACRATGDYRPRSLSDAEWRLARHAVSTAVAAARPTEADRPRFASIVCKFLAMSPAWDHQREPEMRELVTERSISQHDARLAANGRSDSSRYNARACFRRISRALRGGQPRIVRAGPMRGRAYILHPDQLADLARRGAEPGVEALTLAAQIGAGLSGHAAARLRPEQIDSAQGVIRVGDDVIGVLFDMTAFIEAARLHAADGPSAVDGWRGALLPDALTRPVWLLAHLQAGTPLAVVDRASRAGRGRGLQRHELEQLIPHLRLPTFGAMTGNAQRSGAGTVPDDSLAAARALRATLTAVGVEVPADVQDSSLSTPEPARRRRHSRAEALRIAKQAMAESVTLRDPLHLADELADISGWDTLPEEVCLRIADYRPARVTAGEWAAVEAIARRLMAIRMIQHAAAAEPVTRRKVNVLGSHLARYLVWAQQHLVHRDELELASTVLEETSLDRYTNEAMLNEPRATIATRRSEVRGALRAARPGLHPPKLAYRAVRPPYTAAVAVMHIRLCRNQPTRARRRALSFIVAAGYGAGLDGRDMARVRACDITALDVGDDRPGVVIQVRGDRARTVVVMDQYTDLLLEAVRLHYAEGRGRRGLLLGNKPGRRNVTTPVFEQLVTADETPVDIEVPRLRSTWLVAHMSAPVPLAALLSAAGLRSARALVDLLPYTTLPEPNQCTALLRGRPGLVPIDAAMDKETAA